MGERTGIKTAFCVWLTGLPCSGKTTLAKRLAELLQKEGLEVKVYDGDEVRRILSKELGFSKEDRYKNVLMVAELAKEFLSKGPNKIVICSLVSPYRALRKKVREILGDSYIEVFVDCPLEVCEKRDVKGMYKKARAGLIKNFTGIDDPYEPPEAPEVHVKTAEKGPEECLQVILGYLKRRCENK